jgi:hypothetical protein
MISIGFGPDIFLIDILNMAGISTCHRQYTFGTSSDIFLIDILSMAGINTCPKTQRRDVRLSRPVHYIRLNIHQYTGLDTCHRQYTFGSGSDIFLIDILNMAGISTCYRKRRFDVQLSRPVRYIFCNIHY